MLQENNVHCSENTNHNYVGRSFDNGITIVISRLRFMVFVVIVCCKESKSNGKAGEGSKVRNHKAFINEYFVIHEHLAIFSDTVYRKYEYNHDYVAIQIICHIKNLGRRFEPAF